MGKKSVLVSGGAGYIGSHTTVELIAAGYDVVIADNLSNSDMSGVEGVRSITGVDVPFVNVDCCDKEAFAELFKQYDFDSVIHFAAFKAVGESVADPMKYYRNNLLSFLNIIDLMREYGRRNIVFSSSATVYGEAEELPVTEQTERKPATSAYGNTKQMCEDILRDAVTAYPELKGIALRYFNPIGAHPSALIGELPRGVPQNLVPYVTQTAAGVRECLSIFGDDYPTEDGSCLRDYIDIVSNSLTVVLPSSAVRASSPISPKATPFSVLSLVPSTSMLLLKLTVFPSFSTLTTALRSSFLGWMVVLKLMSNTSRKLAELFTLPT